MAQYFFYIYVGIAALPLLIFSLLWGWISINALLKSFDRLYTKKIKFFYRSISILFFFSVYMTIQCDLKSNNILCNNFLFFLILIGKEFIAKLPGTDYLSNTPFFLGLVYIIEMIAGWLFVQSIHKISSKKVNGSRSYYAWLVLFLLFIGIFLWYSWLFGKWQLEGFV